jgi:hypothetical protein
MATNWNCNLSRSMVDYSNVRNVYNLFGGEVKASNSNNTSGNNNTNDNNNNTNKDTPIRVTTTNNVVEETASPLPQAKYGGHQGEWGAAHNGAPNEKQVLRHRDVPRHQGDEAKIRTVQHGAFTPQAQSRDRGADSHELHARTTLYRGVHELEEVPTQNPQTPFTDQHGSVTLDGVQEVLCIEEEVDRYGWSRRPPPNSGDQRSDSPVPTVVSYLSDPNEWHFASLFHACQECGTPWIWINNGSLEGSAGDGRDICFVPLKHNGSGLIHVPPRAHVVHVVHVGIQGDLLPRVNAMMERF